MHFNNLIEETLVLLVIFSYCVNGEFDCPRTVIQCKTHCTRKGFGHAKCYGRKCKCYFKRKLPEDPDFENDFRKQPVIHKSAATCHILRLNIASYIKCIASLYPKGYKYLFPMKDRLAPSNDKLFPSNNKLFQGENRSPNFERAGVPP